MGYLGSFSKSRCSREPKDYVGIKRGFRAAHFKDSIGDVLRNTHIGTQRDINCSGSQGFGSVGSSGLWLEL